MTQVETEALNLAGASQSAIQHHYDAGNDFYELWLDRQTMAYSCALYESDDASLEDAQLAKLDYWVDQLQLEPTDRLLDIGCGWGGMLRRAEERVPTLTTRGLTLSAAQREHDVALGLDVSLQSWEDHESDGYDAIVSLGAFEHFARGGMTRSERVVRYRSFFERCYDWLPVGGRLGLQTIALDDQPERIDQGLGQFFVEHVFPESSLPRLAEVVEASEELFRHVALRIDPQHYARTCREWRHRLVANRELATERVGKSTVDHYRKMLFLSEREFLTGSTTLYRFTMERRAVPVSSARDLTGRDLIR